MIIAALAAAWASPAFAVGVDELPRLGGHIEVDGVLADGEWSEALRIELHYETEPAENGPAPVKTTAYLAEDGENLYVAFDARDPEPGKIRAYLRDRDTAWEDDYVGVVLDTWNDERRAFQFFANPLGVQMDNMHNDVDDGGVEDWEVDASWDAIWESAGKLNGSGYVVEMRIPLSQLRFPAVDGERTWGLDLVRSKPRERYYRFANNAQDRNRNCYLCQLGKLRGLEGSKPSRDIEIVPTLTASRSSFTDDPAIEPIASGDADVEAGITARWGITPDLTANLTINPDFSQIESDVLQLDVNNRFALEFPERRPFFLDGVDYFRTPINAVFTRTISDPEVGVKLTGKRNAHTFGVFAARDAETSLLFPGPLDSDSETLALENTAFVSRYSYSLGNTSSLGALVTARDGDDYRNIVGGIDGRWKFNDQHSLVFQHLETETEYPQAIAIEFEQPQGTFDGHSTQVEYEYDARNWFGSLEWTDRSPGFRADSGFIRRVGADETEATIGYRWHGDEGSWWDTIRISANYEKTNASEGYMLEEERMLRFGFGGHLQSWIQFSLIDKREFWEGVYYDRDVFRVYAEARPVGPIWIGGLVVVGDQVDYSNNQAAEEVRIEPYLDWDLSRRLLLRLEGNYTQLETPEGEEIFTAAIADVRLTWQFNLRSFLRVTTQFSDIEQNQAQYIEPIDARERDVGRQLIYSYKLNPQTVFFLGYSDEYIDNDSLDGLTASDRTWFMKIGYAWTP